ncbi:hypothetical protein [Actinacidiphila oryziradicis]|uniref:Uncharacterized protein n=1 Tax=Actinacidiphila oryziradicis TaxID=2571141 RepID=A0A4U0SHH5_9ACTN|nr:hypothetical protein [Actinacidiphila oryziradicis]TKA08503.1 hypothetical protein FCI23_27740 [Actinacidiphila oryziradicis]
MENHDDKQPETKRPRLRRHSPPYNAALDAMVEVLKHWAAEGRVDCYSELSSDLAVEGHRVYHHSTAMSFLLEYACRREHHDGSPVMLSAIVVNKRQLKPSGQFFELAKTYPFQRGTDPEWSWETERDQSSRTTAERDSSQRPPCRPAQVRAVAATISAMTRAP